MYLFYLLVFSFFSLITLWPQGNNIIAPAPKKQQDSGKQAITGKISSLQQQISQKIQEIETNRKKLLEYDDSVEDEIYINHPVQGSHTLGRVDTYKFTRLQFSSDTIKNIRIVTHKVHRDRPLQFSYKSLHFQPGAIEDAKVRIQTAGSTDVSDVKSFFPETKLKIYKLIYNSLANASLQLGFQVEKKAKEKKEMEKKRADF